MVELRLKERCRIAVRCVAALISAACLFCVPLVAFADDGVDEARGAGSAGLAVVMADSSSDEAAESFSVSELVESSDSLVEADRPAGVSHPDATTPSEDADASSLADSETHDAEKPQDADTPESADEARGSDSELVVVVGGEEHNASGRHDDVASSDSVEAGVAEASAGSAADEGDGDVRLAEPVEDDFERAGASDYVGTADFRPVDSITSFNVGTATKAVADAGPDRNGLSHKDTASGASAKESALPADEVTSDFGPDERYAAYDGHDAPGDSARSAKPDAESRVSGSPQPNPDAAFEATAVGKGSSQWNPSEAMTAASIGAPQAWSDEDCADPAESSEVPVAEDDCALLATVPVRNGLAGYAFPGSTGGLPLVPPEFEVSVRLAKAFSQTDGNALLSQGDSVRVALRSWRYRDRDGGKTAAGKSGCTRCRSPSLQVRDAD